MIYYPPSKYHTIKIYFLSFSRWYVRVGTSTSRDAESFLMYRDNCINFRVTLLRLNGGRGRPWGCPMGGGTLGPPIMIVTFSVLVVLFSVVTGETRSPRVVDTRQGKLRGIIRPLANKSLRPVEVFLGVPYAAPPTGSNRFSPTRAPGPWDGERQANQHGPVCPQIIPDLISSTAPKERLRGLRKLTNYLKNQAEDCLYLNVYVPSQGK